MLNNQNQKPSTDNLFIIKATNDLMTKENHSKSISIGDSVVFDRTIEPYSGCIALINLSNDKCIIAQLKSSQGGFIAHFLSSGDIAATNIKPCMVAAVGSSKYSTRDFN